MDQLGMRVFSLLLHSALVLFRLILVFLLLNLVDVLFLLGAHHVVSPFLEIVEVLDQENAFPLATSFRLHNVQHRRVLGCLLLRDHASSNVVLALF